MKFNIKILKDLNPCEDGIYNFIEKYPNFDGTLIQALQLEDIPYDDKIWVATRIVNHKINFVQR